MPDMECLGWFLLYQNPTRSGVSMYSPETPLSQLFFFGVFMNHPDWRVLV